MGGGLWKFFVPVLQIFINLKLLQKEIFKKFPLQNLRGLLQTRLGIPPVRILAPHTQYFNHLCTNPFGTWLAWGLEACMFDVRSGSMHVWRTNLSTWWTRGRSPSTVLIGWHIILMPEWQRTVWITSKTRFDNMTT